MFHIKNIIKNKKGLNYNIFFLHNIKVHIDNTKEVLISNRRFIIVHSQVGKLVQIHCLSSQNRC